MLSSDPRPHVLHGQGKNSITILTEDGCIYPIISSLSHNDRKRIQSANFEYHRGSRPMHRTTFQMAKPDYEVEDAYKTSSNQFFSGSKTLNPVRRPPLCPSMHRSQWRIGSSNNLECGTSYKQTYMPKEIIPANRLHLVSFQHKINQTGGDDMKDSVYADLTPTSYWTQNNRVHGKLGHMLGPGRAQGAASQEKL